MDGQALIVLADAGEVAVLNASGTLLWGWIDGTRSVGQLAEALGNAFGISPARAEGDTLDLLEELVDLRALVVHDRPGNP